MSWRDISENGYFADGIMVKPGIKPGTLCRFAKAKGTYIPVDIELQKALGIYRERQRPAKMISEMSSIELLYCLNHRAPLVPTMTQKELRDYVRACKRPRTS